MSDTTLLHCSYCGASQHEVRKIVAGPSVFICNDCVGKALSSLVTDQPATSEKLATTQSKSSELFYCSFCGKPGTEVKRLLSRNGVCICNECLVLSLDILTEGGASENASVPF
ncbi:MAG: hypothetical protein IPP88_06855 [Betaproteobacteria bacterium]|nr:hypothetical protein [Betaproteobacteria bacterium]